MTDKVLNPLTKRYINKDGALAKKLIKQGVIILNVEIKKSASPQPVLKYKSPTKSPIKINNYLKYLSEFTDLQKISTQGSSKIYNGILNNEKYYIKEVVKSSSGRKNQYGVFDIELAINELLASKIYTEIYDIDAIKLYIVVNDLPNNTLTDQKYLVGSKSILIDACEHITKDCEDLIENKISGAIEPFFVDCILANWDIGSRGNVGIISDGRKKRAFRIDVGGSLLYRAMGAPRVFGVVPNEHESFFNISNKGYKLFKNLNTKQINIMFNVISKVTTERFDSLHTEFLENINKIPQEDFKKTQKILKVIDIVKKRHKFYINNETSIKKFLESKIVNK